MTVRQESVNVKEDPSAGAVEAGGGGFSGAEPVGQAGGELRPDAPSARVRRRRRHGPAVDDVNDNDLGLNGGADPAEPVPAQQDPPVREGQPAGGVAADIRRAGGDAFDGNEMLRPAAHLALQVGALTLLGEADAPWPTQFGALMFWFAGCVALFLYLSRR